MIESIFWVLLIGFILGLGMCFVFTAFLDITIKKFMKTNMEALKKFLTDNFDNKKSQSVDCDNKVNEVIENTEVDKQQ